MIPDYEIWWATDDVGIPLHELADQPVTVRSVPTVDSRQKVGRQVPARELISTSYRVAFSQVDYDRTIQGGMNSGPAWLVVADPTAQFGIVIPGFVAGLPQDVHTADPARVIRGPLQFSQDRGFAYHAAGVALRGTDQVTVTSGGITFQTVAEAVTSVATTPRLVMTTRRGG